MKNFKTCVLAVATMVYAGANPSLRGLKEEVKASAASECNADMQKISNISNSYISEELGDKGGSYSSYTAVLGGAAGGFAGGALFMYVKDNCMTGKVEINLEQKFNSLADSVVSRCEKKDKDYIIDDGDKQSLKTLITCIDLQSKVHQDQAQRKTRLLVHLTDQHNSARKEAKNCGDRILSLARKTAKKCCCLPCESSILAYQDKQVYSVIEGIINEMKVNEMEEY